MTRVLLLIALRLALCAGVMYPVWRVLGIGAVVLMSPLIGVALAKPLIDLASEMRALMRSQSFAPIEGRHYSFKSRWIHVIEDDRHVRWLRTEHLRAIMPGLPPDGTLQRLYPVGCSTRGRPPMSYLNDIALLDFLGKATAADTLRFRTWVEREVAFPAKRLRRRAALLDGRRDVARADDGTHAEDAPESASRPHDDSRPPPAVASGPAAS